MRADTRARCGIVDELAARSDEAAIAALIDMHPAEPTGTVRRRIRAALTRKCRAQHAVVLAAAWAGRSDEERLLLLDALTAAKSPSVFELWIEYFVRHPLAGYRASAADGIRRLDVPDGDPYLFELARDPHPVPRRHALEAFGALRRDGMLAVVIEGLWDVDRDVADEAQRQVRKFERRAWEALVAAIGARGASEAALRAVERYVGFSASVPLFLEAIVDPAAGVRLGALQCLNSWTHIQSEELSDAVGRAARDPDVAVRTRAVLALRWFAKTPLSRAALEAAVNDPERAVAEMAVDSLRRSAL